MGVAARTTSELSLVRKGSNIRAALWNTAGVIASGFVLLIAVGVILYGLVLALQWYNQPFLGIVYYPSGVLLGTHPLTENNTWIGLQVGLQADDRIIRIDSATFDGSDNTGPAINAVLAKRSFGQRVSVEVLRPISRLRSATDPNCTVPTGAGARCNFTFALQQMPFVDFLGYFGLGFIVAIIGMGVGVWLWFARRQQAEARSVAAMCAVGAIVFIGRFENTATFQFTPLMFAGFCLLGGLALQLGMYFPYPLTNVRLRPVFGAIPIVLTAGLLTLFVLIKPEFGPTAPDIPVFFLLLYLIGTNLFLVVSMFIRRRQATSAVAREQSALVLVGALVPLIPFGLWFLTNYLERVNILQNISFSTIYLQPPALIFPLAIAYAITQQRRVDTDRVISEGFVLSVLGVVLVIGYILVTAAVFTLSAGIIQPDNPLLIAGTLFIIAVLFTPLRRYMETKVDDAFFRRRRFYQHRLEQFARELTTTIQRSDVVSLLSKELSETLAPHYHFIFLRNMSSGEYESVIDPKTEKPQTNIRFEPNSGLLKLMSGQQTVIYLERENIAPADLQSDRPRLAVLNTPVLARLRSVRRLNGFIAVGPRRDRGQYSHEDLRFLEGLAEQAAAAFERAQVVLEAGQNERELKVLFQVSAALNIAMDFDVLLEFIYAQVDKVITAPNFYIALFDEKNDELYYAFYQEEGERLSEKEGPRWRLGRDLISEIVKTKQPFRTDSYVREMQRRDNSAQIDNPNLKAWVGVPLNAGEGRTLGALALATTDQTLTYSEDQTRIFWSIGDLAATALYKTRLFSETAELARQMQVLNETSSRLATLFEDIDALLQKITESAVEILNCEAGSLLLVDDDNGDLVFRYIYGGMGENLIGRRIPPGSGIVGTVVKTGHHVIVNDPTKDPRWFGEVGNGNNNRMEFMTNAILAVPLNSRGKVLGVLEVVNKRDGTPFDESNANLLTTFAGQAAIAIENANLFRLTDEALAERIKQLFNMQRIDQELNRTLDLQRVVDLTVDNAIRESGADAGALALYQEDPIGLRIVGCAGYPERILAPDKVFDAHTSILGEVFQTGQPILTSGSEASSKRYEVLPGAQNQLCVPLITGETVTGVLLLESTLLDTFTQLTVEHIQGLAEHANTAITNAQLFRQLDQANEARIQFIGTVAHELGNPMTSIKGYLEMLLSGMGGQLSDRQKDSLATIRRNIVRMQTLVGDLRDIAAQERGQLTLTKKAVNFTNVVLEAVRPQQHAIDEKKQTLILNVPEELPKVWGDEMRLIQIMVNLVSNANKYTPEGGAITITAERARNKWDSGGPAEVIHCQVTDTGIGMSDEDLKSLFRSYWRSENPKAREQVGTGLGMSLTRGLIESHTGKVWVESKLNIGTTFHFTIPLAAEVEPVRR